MSKIIKVNINEDGRTAKEINLFKKPNSRDYLSRDLENDNSQYWKKYDKWQKAEASLRTFEIDEYKGNPFAKPNSGKSVVVTWINPYAESAYDAEILPNGKIKIL